MRSESKFRKFIYPPKDDEQLESANDFVAAPGRYHLFVSLACPWAHRCLLVRRILQLEDVVPVTVVHPTWQYTKPHEDKHCGWVFQKEEGATLSSPAGYGTFHCKGCMSNTVNDAKTIREMYEMCGDVSGKYSVPFIWDIEQNVIVNNESSEICRMLNNAFRSFTKSTVDLYPPHLRHRIDATNELLYESINNGVYKCGFTTSQVFYDRSVEQLFRAMGEVEEILSKEDFVCGSDLTESDIRLFVTTIRFDEVYSCYFKCNHRTIYRDYPNIWRWMKRIYQMDGVADTVDMDHIKTHYYTSHPTFNPYAIIPKGPGIIELLNSS